jgi:hypothetical protein
VDRTSSSESPDTETFFEQEAEAIGPLLESESLHTVDELLDAKTARLQKLEVIARRAAFGLRLMGSHR